MNLLYYGDNLNVLRENISAESVDLVYLDPPFNSQSNYNVLFRSPSGVGSQAQIEAFEDSWHWGSEAEFAFDDVMRSGNTRASDLLRAVRTSLGESDLMAYLTMMASRLIELHRVLTPNGSLYLHCDPTASHYLKIVLDSIFGASAFRNEISWRRSNPKGHHSVNFPNCRDVILRYSKGPRPTFNRLFSDHDPEYVEKAYRYKDSAGRRYRLLPLLNPSDNRPNLTYEFLGVTRVWRWTRERMEQAYRDGLVVQLKSGAVPQYIKYLEDSEGRTITNDWHDVPPVHGAEPLGYPTQKPVALLERIISASSNLGDTVLDPFCGCGTTVHAAQLLDRKWIGIDITHLAISLIERRLKDAFPGVKFEILGTPKDIDGARDLALRDRYQFQWWAVSLVEAQPFGGKKKGSDGGIDGLIYFRSDAKIIERAVVSVKSGDVSVSMIRDLKGVLDREKAPIGVFLTLEKPTKPMETEAAAAGFFQVGDRRYPRLQILTIEAALAGSRPSIPLIDTGVAFRRAAREERRKGQSELRF